MFVDNIYKYLTMTIRIKDLKNAEFHHREYLKDSEPKSALQTFKDSAAKIFAKEQNQNTFLNKLLTVDEYDGLFEYISFGLIKSTINQVTGIEETYNTFGAKLSGSFDRAHANRLKDMHSRGEEISDDLALDLCHRGKYMETQSKKAEPATAKAFHYLTDYFKSNNPTAICEGLLEEKGAEELFYSVFITKPGFYLNGNAQYYRNEIKLMLADKGISKNLEDISSSSVDCLIEKAELVKETSMDADFILANYASCGI